MASYHSRVVERRARAANDETLLLNRCEQLVCPAAAAAAAVVVVRRRPAPRLRVVARVFVCSFLIPAVSSTVDGL